MEGTWGKVRDGDQPNRTINLFGGKIGLVGEGASLEKSTERGKRPLSPAQSIRRLSEKGASSLRNKRRGGSHPDMPRGDRNHPRGKKNEKERLFEEKSVL